MKFTTTLAILREHQPCTEGWKKLLKHLGPKYPKTKPIGFATIIESNGLQDALWGLSGVMPEQEKDRDRLARLFACECAEAIISNFEKEYPEDKRPREALICARQFANGERSSAEMEAARSAASSAASSAAEAASSAASSAAEAAWSAAEAAWSAASSAARSAAEAASSAARSAAEAAQKQLFIEYFCTPVEQGRASMSTETHTPRHAATMSTELTAKQLQENRDVAALQQWKSPHSNPMPFDYWMAACAYAREETSARLAAAESKVAGLRAALAGARKGVSAVYSCASEIRRREAMIEAHSSIDAALKPNLP